MEYKSQNVICQNCKKDFIIESEDFSFYEKIKVPPPTWCPECRVIRRISFQNTWNLYWRNCDKCREKTLSRYSVDQKLVVYCQKCWWADDWDGTEFATEYDPSKPFLLQIKELLEKTPHVALNNLYTSNKNCIYVNSTAWSKDCYLTFWTDFCENVYYSSLLNHLKNSSDCIRGYYSELCYESIGFSRCYKMFFSNECDDCLNIWFCRNCYNCTDCVGCVNLSGASNCIFNVKYSKEEYKKRIEELNLKSWSSLNKLKNKAFNFWLTKPYRAYHGHSLNYNVTGDYIFTSKNSKECYLLNGGEDCKYCQFITVPSVKDCYDYSGWGNNVNLTYESVTVGENANSIFFSNECWPDVLNLQYCFWNISGKNNFGCSNLKRKQYCILNKEYSKEDFKILKEKIINDMKLNPYIDKIGRKYYYGEFFPLEFSEFVYNKSNAMRFFKKTKEEALALGFGWDDKEKEIGISTIKAANLPETINDIKQSILKEAIECILCQRPYNINQGELDLLKKLDLPIPRKCHKCRENERFDRMTMPGLFNRRCHKCQKIVKTSYAPDRPEIIYCEQCYKKEIY